MKRILNYNNSLAMASFCPSYDEKHVWPPVVKVGGAVYHRFNPGARPRPNEIPKYGQLYFIDTEEAVENRLRHQANEGMSRELASLLDKMVRERSQIARSYKMMKDYEEQVNAESRANGIDPPALKLLFDIKKGADLNRYNIPESNEVDFFTF